MKWPVQWASLVAVAIMMIVACFAAPLAEAHEGHAGHAVAAAERPAAGPAHGFVVANSMARSAAIKTAMAERAGPSLGPTLAKTAVGRTTIVRVHASLEDRGCDGCCCSTGCACCSPGMAAQNAITLPPPAKPGRLVAGSQPQMTSLASEALPEPPRSLA